MSQEKMYYDDREFLFRELCDLLNKETAMKLMEKVDKIVEEAKRDALELQHF